MRRVVPSLSVDSETFIPLGIILCVLDFTLLHELNSFLLDLFSDGQAGLFEHRDLLLLQTSVSRRHPRSLELSLSEQVLQSYVC